MTNLSDIITARTQAEPAPRELRTRPLTAHQRPPLLTIGGGPKVGKSYALAGASADPRVDRLSLIEVGSDRGGMDAYANIAGDALQLVDHDNTWADITAAIQQIINRAPEGDGYTILAIDGVTSLWAVLSREAQAGGRDIGPGGWAAVNATWDNLLSELRRHPGPVIFTARVDADQTGVDLSRIRTQKDLAYDVDATIQAAGYRDFHITGARSAALAGIGRDQYPIPLGDLVIPDVLDLLGGKK